jgi:hypothetical protein
VSGPEHVLIEALSQKRGDPRGDLGPFGVPPWGGKDRSDPRNAVLRTNACETKPIRRSDRSGHGRARSPAEPRSGRLRQTNPICPAPAGRDAGCRSRKPCRPWEQACQTKPISHRQAGMGESRQIALAGTAGPKRAKQSQFPAEQQEEQVLGRKRVMTNWTCPRPRRNKANWHRSVKLEVASVKWTKYKAKCSESSHFKLHTSNPQRAKQTQFVEEFQMRRVKCQVNRVRPAGSAPNKANFRGRDDAPDLVQTIASGARQSITRRPATLRPPCQAQIPCPTGVRAYNGVPYKPFVVGP